MISTPMKQGFLPSSTPVQALNDSGYFGSINKSSLTKTVHKLSPVKESSPFKRAKDLSELISFDCSDISTKEDSPSTSNLKELEFRLDELVKELDFNDTSLRRSNSFADGTKNAENLDQNSFSSFSIHALEDKIVSPNQKASYCWQDKDIGLVLRSITKQKNAEQLDSDKDSSNCVHSEASQKWDDTQRRIKYIKLDFLRELQKINCISTLKNIFSFLSPADLTKVGCVSKKWREILISDVKANSRRKKFLKEKQDHKENQQHLTTILKVNQKGEARRPVSLYKTVLSDINNIKTPPKQPLAIKLNGKFDSFIEEGKKLKDGILKKCPKCEFAAKTQSSDKYSCTNCFYVFCGNCLNPFVARNHSCLKQTVSIIIGSKKSKKNLKRL